VICGSPVGRFVLRIAGVGLGIAMWMAVLAFGGTSPPFFLLTQVIILGLGILLVSASLRIPLATIHFPLLAPLFLIALVLLQILPFPAFADLRGGSMRDALANNTAHTLSVAP